MQGTLFIDPATDIYTVAVLSFFGQQTGRLDVFPVRPTRRPVQRLMRLIGILPHNIPYQQPYHADSYHHQHDAECRHKLLLVPSVPFTVPNQNAPRHIELADAVSQLGMVLELMGKILCGCPHTSQQHQYQTNKVYQTAASCRLGLVLMADRIVAFVLAAKHVYPLKFNDAFP